MTHKHITADDAKLLPFDTDVSKELADNKTIEGYLNYILEYGDEADLKRALGHIAKAKGMTTVSKEIGVSRASLYKSLNGERSVGLDTVLKLLKSLGISLSAKVVKVS